MLQADTNTEDTMKDCKCAIRNPRECPRHGYLYNLDAPWPTDDSAGDLVPGYLDSADGLADAADQRRADR